MLLIRYRLNLQPKSAIRIREPTFTDKYQFNQKHNKMSRTLHTPRSFCLAAVLAALPLLSLPSQGAAAEEPIISMVTQAHVQAGGKKLSFRLMASETTSVTVDFGDEEKTFEITASASPDDATWIDGPIPADGEIKVYGDPQLIDYVDLYGAYLSQAEMSRLSNLSVLILSHNQLTDFDFSPFKSLQYLDIRDNAFANLKLDQRLDELAYLDISYSATQIDYSFSLANYPNLLMFESTSMPIYSIDPSVCPGLIQLSIDGTNVSYLDLSGNPELRILNISETQIRNIDVTPCPKLEQLYCNHEGSLNNEYKISSLDVSQNPQLKVLFCTGNQLTDIDVSNNPLLTDLYAGKNHLTHVDISENPDIINLSIRRNDFTFATMPIVDERVNLEWSPMNPMKVDPAYPEGASIDLSDKVLREGGETYAMAFMVNNLEPSDPIQLVEGTDYTYADGTVTLKREMADSCYVEFFNTLFDGGVTATSNFKVKSKEQFGKPTKVVSMTTLAEAGTELSYNLYLGARNADYDNPVEIYVDFGNGELVPFQVTSQSPVNGTVAGPEIGIYVPDGQFLSDLEVNGVPLAGINVSAARELEVIDIENCGIEDIDLSWNNKLTKINVSNNNLRSLDLSGVNKAFVKNVLTQVYAFGNQIGRFVIENNDIITDINLADNDLEEIDITDAEFLTSLNLSGNRFAEINLSGCKSMQNLDLSRNDLTSLSIPEEALSTLTSLKVDNNAFDFATLPVKTATMYSFQYAPQAMIDIPSKAYRVDLSKQCVDVPTSYITYDENWQPTVVTETNPTVITWFDAEGNELAEGSDYTVDNGITSFSGDMVGRNVYAVLSNASLPDFSGDNALTTTVATLAGAPQCVLASFTTTEGGQTVDLRMASAEEDTYVYVDWSGDGSYMQECQLSTTYTAFEATTTKGADVKVLAYDDNDPITVFSMTGASVKDVDVTKMKNAVMIGISHGELEEITLPESDNLRELVLEGNNLKAVDLSRNPNLYSVVLDDNMLEAVDFSANGNIEWLSISDNSLKTLDVSMLPGLYQLHAHRNNLEAIDLSANPRLGTIGFESNMLSQLDLSHNLELLQVIIGRNRMNFATLPLPREEWGTLYSYSNQEPMSVKCEDGKVDLSSQAEVESIPTTYYWFLGVPELDPEAGTVTGVLLEEDTDYTIENGVTTFLRKPTDYVTCVMQNEVFPYLALFTDPVEVNISGIDTVENDAPEITLQGNTITVSGASNAEICDINGISITMAHHGNIHEAANLYPGIYLVKADGTTRKVIVK